MESPQILLRLHQPLSGPYHLPPWPNDVLPSSILYGFNHGAQAMGDALCWLRLRQSCNLYPRVSFPSILVSAQQTAERDHRELLFDIWWPDLHG